MKQIYLLLLINFCSTVFLKTPIQAQKKLSIIGSSTAQCFGITGDSCFVGRLKNFYGNAVQFTNLAVSGSNVYRGMPSSYTPPAERVNETPDINYNITAALSSNPEVVLVNYPSNGYDVFSVAEVMFCLRTINAAAITAGARCYITTTQPRSDPASFTSGETRRKMAEIKDSVLQQFGTFAINFWDGIVNPADSTIITELGQGDGTHLNNKGHAILFQKVKDKDIFLLNSPLPLSFVGFSATTGNGETTLQWITAMEKNIRHFELMRSIDGIQFSKIATIKANNTMQNNRYSFTDKSPLPATSYYQVVAINLNSHPDYSQTIKVLNNRLSYVLRKTIYRNAMLTVTMESGEEQLINMQVLNSNGQIFNTTKATIQPGITTIPFAVGLPAKGLYFIRILNNKNAPLVKPFVHE